MRSKTFDFATSCSTENACVIHESIYDNFIKALDTEGGYLLSSEEKEKLQSVMWHDGHLNTAIRITSYNVCYTKLLRDMKYTE